MYPLWEKNWNFRAVKEGIKGRQDEKEHGGRNRKCMRKEMQRDS